MWKKENFYFEQANVNFRNELIVEILTDDPLTGTETFLYSTVKSINQLSMNELGQPLIWSRTNNDDSDGKMDSFDLHLELKSLSGR
jgi:hypothetical protein